MVQPCSLGNDAWRCALRERGTNNRIHTRHAKSVRKGVWLGKQEGYEHIVAVIDDPDGNLKIPRCRTARRLNATTKRPNNYGARRDTAGNMSEDTHARGTSSPSCHVRSALAWTKTQNCVDCMRYGRRHHVTCKKRKMTINVQLDSPQYIASNATRSRSGRTASRNFDTF